jgi:hypothetical protein
MKSAIPSDLLNLKARFEAWRKTRTKRSKTPDHLLKAAAALLDHYSASMVCRVCGINLRTLQRRTSSISSPRRSAPPAPDFFPLSLSFPQEFVAKKRLCRVMEPVDLSATVTGWRSDNRSNFHSA